MSNEATKRIVECVVSHSIDKKQNLLCDETILKSVCFSFLTDQGYPNDELNFENILNKAKAKGKPTGTYPLWVIFALVVGVALLVTELINLFYFGIDLSFVFFLLLGGSLLKTAFSYMFSVRKIRKVSKMWKLCLREPTKENMESTLKRIASLYQ